jgi:hypothetical protein
VKRTQLYLDDDLWQALHNRARSEGTTISEMVRQAARERYLPDMAQRREAMQAFIGTRKDRPEFRNPVAYVRGLRRGARTERLGKV